MSRPDLLAAAPLPPPDTTADTDPRGLVLFLVVTFGVAWALWGLLAATGGLGRPVALPVLAASMYAPAVGTLAARVWGGTPLPRLGVRRRGPWRWYLLVLVLVPSLLLLGATLCVLAGLQQFDPAFTELRRAAEQTGAPPIPPEVLIVQLIPATTVAPLFNMVFAAGEEIGWRGYLLAHLQGLGPRRAALTVGLVWGVWHAPVIAMGWNYPGEPVRGPLMMIVFTMVYGVVLAWLRARSGSIWPPALAHGAINAEAGAVGAFLTPASPIVGAPIGLVALVPAALLAAALLWRGRWEQAA